MSIAYKTRCRSAGEADEETLRPKRFSCWTSSASPFLSDKLSEWFTFEGRQSEIIVSITAVRSAAIRDGPIEVPDDPLSK